MDLRIGLTQTVKELEIHLPEDADQAAVRAEVESGLSKGGSFWITDRKGRQHGIVAEKVAYVEIGSPEDDRRIGFGG